MSDPLASLRPLHLPAPVGWWPPAPGWWLLAGGVLLVAAAVWWYYRRTALRRVALAELQRLQQQVTDDGELTAALNLLLRRVALSCFPRGRVASLQGNAWLAFLDTRVGGFVSGPGQVLATAPSQRGCTVDRAALVALVQRWIRQACRRRA